MMTRWPMLPAPLLRPPPLPSPQCQRRYAIDGHEWSCTHATCLL